MDPEPDSRSEIVFVTRTAICEPAQSRWFHFEKWNHVEPPKGKHCGWYIFWGGPRQAGYIPWISCGYSHISGYRAVARRNCRIPGRRGSWKQGEMDRRSLFHCTMALHDGCTGRSFRSRRLRTNSCRPASGSPARQRARHVLPKQGFRDVSPELSSPGNSCGASGGPL